MALVKNVCPLGERLLVEHGVVLPGEVVDVPDDLAGRAPGPWRPPTADEAAGRGTPTDPLQWQLAGVSETDGELWLCRDPGAGLLAQEDVWQPATAPAGGGNDENPEG